MAICGGRIALRLVVLFVAVAASTSDADEPACDGCQPAGRYAHCAAVFRNHMIVYGGRGFREHKRSLTTLGCVPTVAHAYPPRRIHCVGEQPASRSRARGDRTWMTAHSRALLILCV